MFHELLSRDREDGRATWKPSRGTAGLVSVPEQYVAGADTRGRQEGWPYLRSQQVIHEISGLGFLPSLMRGHYPTKTRLVCNVRVNEHVR